jgi:outer membrane biosynthesis protein TonB
MRKPVVISIGFHAAILLATLVVLPAPAPFEVKPVEVIQVDISQITDKTQKMATAKEAAPKVEKAAPKETKVVKDVPPAPKVADEVKTAANEPTEPPPEPPKPEPPKPKPEPPKPKPAPPKPVEPTPLDSDPLKDLLKKVEEPKPEKKPDAKPVEKPAPTKTADAKKSDKKKPDLKLEDISAFLDKQKGEKTAPAKPTTETGSPKLAENDAQGNDQVVTATLINALTSKVKGCFNVPPAARDADISVRIHFLLNQDGSVNGQPEVASLNSDPIFDATARAAVSAILECQNYELPPDQYELWKDNTLDFNPNLLFGT